MVFEKYFPMYYLFNKNVFLCVSYLLFLPSYVLPMPRTPKFTPVALPGGCLDGYRGPVSQPGYPKRGVLGL
jgi:hypothetical protein